MSRASRVKGIRQYGGVLIVTVRINGWDFKLLADTGAALCAITKDVATLLNIDFHHPVRLDQVVIASGAKIAAPVVKLKEVKVGGYQASGLEALVLEFPSGLRLDGLLGVNFLEALRPTFEFDTATLVLRRAGNSPIS